MISDTESYKRVRTLDDAKAFLDEFPDSIHAEEIRQRKYLLCTSHKKETWVDGELFQYELAAHEYDKYGVQVHTSTEVRDAENMFKHQALITRDHNVKGMLIRYHCVAKNAVGEVIYERLYRHELEHNEEGLLVAETVTEEDITNRAKEESITHYKHDCNNRIVQTICNGEATDYEYDLAGNKVFERASDLTTKNVYDDDNRLIREERSDGYYCDYSYIVDSEGIVSVEKCVSSDGCWVEYSYTFDSDGFVSTRTSAWSDGSLWVEHYDQHGSLILSINHSSPVYWTTSLEYELRTVIFADR